MFGACGNKVYHDGLADHGKGLRFEEDFIISTCLVDGFGRFIYCIMQQKAADHLQPGAGHVKESQPAGPA
jgi:hypothetical protein